MKSRRFSDVRRHWAYRLTAALCALVMVSTSAVPFAEAARFERESKRHPPVHYGGDGLNPFALVATEPSFGEPPPAVGSGPEAPQIVLPVKVEVLRAEARHFDPWALFDGSSRGLNGAFRVRVEFASPRKLSGLGIFAANSRPTGTLTLTADAGGTAAAASLELASERGAAGWQRSRSETPVVAKAFVLEWRPSSPGAAAPEELELVALAPLARNANRDEHDDLYAEGVAGAVETRATPSKRAITSTAAARLDVALAQDPRTFARAFLVYELIGVPHFTNVRVEINRATTPVVEPGAARTPALVPGAPAALGSGGLQVQEIDPLWLQRGANTIRFLPSETRGTYFVRNLRVVGVPEDGTSSSHFAAGLRLGARGYWFDELDFTRPTQPHELVLQLLHESAGSLTVRATDARSRAVESVVELRGRKTGWQRVPIELPATQELAIQLVESREDRTSPVGAYYVLGSPLLSQGSLVGRLAVTYPRHGECLAGGAVVQGFVRPPAGIATIPRLSIDGADADARFERGGAFSLWIPEPKAQAGKPWTARLEASFQGRTLRSEVELGPCLAPTHAAGLEEDPGAPLSAVVRAHESQRVTLGAATLDIPSGALDEDVRITMRPLTQDQVASMGATMANVVPNGQAYRFGPHGLKFKKPVRVSLSYDPARIPDGLAERDVQAFYFDEASGKWQAIGRLEEAHDGELVSLTEHFTDFVTATLAQPETPGPQTYNPTQMKDLELADPAAAIELIQPPSANSSGSAMLSQAIEVPPGRGSLEPDLSFTYDSSAGNGWLGLGWGVRLSSIRVDTRFGVPRYTGDERYVYDGSQLVPVPGADGAASANPRRYQRRVEGAFDRIERFGTDATNYYWVVTAKSGAKTTYGRCPRPSADATCSESGAAFWTKLDDPRAVAGAGTIGEWFVESREDTSGNRMTVRYTRDVWEHGERFVQLYPKRIDYTSHVTGGTQDLEPAYRVEFGLAKDASGGTFQRKDVILDGTLGFPNATRRLLGSVDVKLLAGASGPELIRRYRLDYRNGDAVADSGHFGKTLLEHITLLGLGAAHELHQHSFEYFDSEKDAENRPLVFDQQKTWGSGLRQSDGMTRTEDDTFGGSGSVGIGIGPFSLSGSAGGFDGNDEVKLMMLDTGGDGLLDHFDDRRAAVFGFLNRDPIAVPVATGGLSALGTLVDGPSSGDLGHTDRSGWTVEGGLNLGGLFGASIGYTRTNTSDDRVVVDMDGDGLMDLVGIDDGHIEVRRGLGDNRFDPSPIEWTTQIAASELVSSRSERNQAATEQIHPVDPLIKWVAPFFGSVAVNGSIQKKEAGGDGVTAQLYQGSSLVWQHTFGPDELTPCRPAPADGCAGGLTLGPLLPGERLYWKATSPVDPAALDTGTDTLKDDLLFDAAFQYVVAEPALSERQPYGARTYSYSTSTDFRLAGLPAMPFVASSKGKVVIDGLIDKGDTTSDDVRVNVTKNGQISEVFGQSFDAAESDEVAVSNTIDVESGDQLFFNVLSSSQIDPARVTWHPVVRYTEYCRFDRDANQYVCGPVACGPESATDPRVSCRLTNDPDPFVRIPLELIVQPAQVLYPAFRWEPAVIHPVFRPSSDTHMTLETTLTKGITPSEVTIFVQGVNRLYHKQTLAPSQTVFGQIQTFGLDLPADEQLFVSVFSAQDPGAALSFSAELNGAPITPTLRTADPSQEPMSGGYHRLFYGDWNGALTFDENQIIAEQPFQGMPFLFVTPRWQGRTGAEFPLWVGRGSDGYTAAGQLKPSRLGSLTTGHRGATGGLGELRASENWNATLGVTVVANFSGSVGDTTSQLDFVDFNGDGYPDLVTPQGVLINDAPNRVFVPRDSFGDVSFPDGDFEDIRRFENRSVGVALSASRQIIQKTDAKGKTKGFVNTSFRVGANYGLTGTAADLVDVNGDGLVDHVFKDPNSNAMSVRLNLGYSFSRPIAWASPAWSVDQITELQDLITELPFTDAVKTGAARLDDTVSLNLGAGVSVGMFGGGAGLTLTTSRQDIDLVDVNGDGLVDQVLRDPSEADGVGNEWIHVKLNEGAGFAPEQRWPMPGWTTEVDPGEFLPLDEPIKISGQKALSFKRARGFSGSVEVNVCVVLCVGGSAYYQQGSGYSALQFQDVDGDSRPDHVLKKHDDRNVYVKLNKIGKTNLLRKVTRPLGGSFELDYERKGNVIRQTAPRADMPSAGWVLARTIVKASPDATPASTGYYLVETHAYDEAFYDRAERENYGYGRVVTTRGTLNTVTGQYENGDGSSTEQRFANQDFYRKGLLLETIDRGSNPKRPDLGFQAKYTDKQQTYAEPPPQVLAAVGTGSFFPRELERETTWFEGETNAQTKVTRESEKEYDSVGNLTHMLAENDIDLAEDDVVYSVKLKSDPAAYIFRPELVRALTPDADPNAPVPEQILRERRAVYDARGRLTSFTQVLRGGKDPASPNGQALYDGTNNPTWSFAYQDALGRDFGNITTSTDPKGFQIRYEYDATTQSHQTKTTDSFGYVSTSDPNLRYGLSDSAEDSNGAVIRYCYDEFGRVSRVYGPNDRPPATSDPCGATPPLEPTIVHTYGTTGLGAAQAPYPAWATTAHKDVQHPNDPIVTANFIDGTKRRLQTKKDLDRDLGAGSGVGPSATTTGMTVSGLVEFDAAGRVKLDHQPSFSTGPATAFVGAPAQNPTRTDYDTLGRVTRIKTANGSETVTDYGIEDFDGVPYFKAAMRDAKQNVRFTFTDASNSTVAVVEHNRLGTLTGADHCEPGAAGCTALVTRYAYDALDQLVSVTDAKGNVVRSEFDTLGRMITLESPDAGKTEWSYDVVGNLGAKQTAKLRALGATTRIRYEYDFNRLRKIDYPDMPDVEYRYGDAAERGDTNGNLASRIKEARSEAGVKTYRYDRLGNLTQETDAIVSINEPFKSPYSYTMKYRYDSFARMQSMQFSNEGTELVEYKYDHGGRIQSIFGNLTTPDPLHPAQPTHVDYLKHVGYDEFDQKRRTVAGNGIETKYDYDPVMRRLTGMFAQSRDTFLAKQDKPARTFQDLHYTYDPVGNITEIRNDAPFDQPPAAILPIGTTRQTFAYDDLYQLRRSDGQLQELAQWQSRQFSELRYDEVGNVTKKEQRDDRFKKQGSAFVFNHTEIPGSYTFDYSYAGGRPHAVAQTLENYPQGTPPRTRDYEYDESGNPLRQVGHNGVIRSQTWDSENRLKTVNDNGEDNLAAVYDCEGLRSNMAAHGEEHVYPNQFLTDRYAQGGKHYVTKHIFADGMRVADKIDASFMNKAPTFYYHVDHLGSSHYVSNDDQDLVEHHEYFASGEQWNSEVDQRYLFRKATTFSDKELDALTGYYYFGARYYDPRLGTFQNPDPDLSAYMHGQRNGGVQTPRNLGVYSYSWNNPVMFRDPTGRYSVWDGISDVLTVSARIATNFLAPAIVLASFGILGAVFTGGSLVAAASSGFATGLAWSFSNPVGLATSLTFAAMGGIHGVRLAMAGSYKSFTGFLAFLLDHTWSLPNTIFASIWATIGLGNPIDKATSYGSGSLFLQNELMGGYATTFGNVTFGTNPAKHEAAHSWQARLFGPFFYPIYVANYVFNTFVPWWLIAKAAGAWKNKPIDSFANYFQRGVYPFVFFELWGYAIEGSPK